MEQKELPIELRNPLPLPPDVFLYVNVLTGRHAQTSLTSKLAVFKDENVARLWEEKSKALKGMVGYWAAWEEMLDIAQKQTGGQYEYFGTAN